MRRQRVFNNSQLNSNDFIRGQTIFFTFSHNPQTIDITTKIACSSEEKQTILGKDYDALVNKNWTRNNKKLDS